MRQPKPQTSPPNLSTSLAAARAGHHQWQTGRGIHDVRLLPLVERVHVHLYRVRAVFQRVLFADIRS